MSVLEYECRPEYSYYDDDDKIIKNEIWYESDHIHREDGPAIIDYYPDGSIEREYWFVRNKCHRLGAPAIIEYYLDGSIERKVWQISDNCHRSNGPAIIEYCHDGTIWRDVWFLNNVEIDAERPCLCNPGLTLREVYLLKDSIDWLNPCTCLGWLIP